jgi:hypothetical protein
MQKNRAGILLSLAAAISLLMAGILFCGYLGYFGPTIAFPRQAGATMQRSLSLELERGRIAFWLDQTHLPTSGPARFTQPGVQVMWQARLDRPDWKRCFWEFDAHRFSTARGTFFLFAFPIWCALVPCLIAPLMWLRRRRPRTQVGFAVITKST